MRRSVYFKLYPRNIFGEFKADGNQERSHRNWDWTNGKDSMGKGRVISFLSFWNSICFKIPQNFIWSFLANIVKLLFYGIQIKHFYPKWQYAFIKFLIGGVSTPMLATTILAMGVNEQPNTKAAKVPTAKKHETCSSFATMHSKPIKTLNYS